MTPAVAPYDTVHFGHIVRLKLNINALKTRRLIVRLYGHFSTGRYEAFAC